MKKKPAKEAPDPKPEPKEKKKHGRFMDAIRWTIPKAASEFGVGIHSLSGWVKEQGIIAGVDGRFSTQDICKSVFGDRDKELLQQTKKENELLDIELARARNEVIEVETVFRVWESVAMSIKRTILTSALTTKEKDAILNELESLKNEKYVEQRKFDETGVEDSKAKPCNGPVGATDNKSFNLNVHNVA